MSRVTTRQVARDLQEMCKPGHEIRVSRHIMQDLAGGMFADFMGIFPAADRILGHIIGSSYEYGYRVDPESRDTIFYRLEKPLEDGRRSFVSPDRMHLFTSRSDGTYELTSVRG